MVRILFIDDDPQVQAILRNVAPDDCLVISAETGKSGMELARSESPDLVFLDIGLPDVDGMEVLEDIASIGAAPPVVMLTASSEPERIVQAVKAGAYDYLVKPLDRIKIARAVDAAIRVRLHRAAASPGTEQARRCGILGEGRAIEEVRRLVSVYARSNATVLVTGESGTGKELVARAIHRLSARAESPIVAVNCGAIPDTLSETELFGSERGAYTDAVSRAGFLETANGGTLFLDEIGEMSSRTQVKLLRVMETREVARVGSNRTRSLDVRFVAATNRDLKADVAGGRFREDLFYRVDILRLSVPALREHLEDLPLLAAHFLRSSGGEARITPGAIEKLCGHSWPGNVRELKNVIERARLLAEAGSIEPGHVVFS